jgi:hypothetical protein
MLCRSAVHCWLLLRSGELLPLTSQVLAATHCLVATSVCVRRPAND